MIINETVENNAEQPSSDEFSQIPNEETTFLHRQRRLVLLGLTIVILIVGSYYLTLELSSVQNDTFEENEVSLDVDNPVSNQSEPSNLTAAPQTEESQKNIHLYPAYGLDPSVSINRLHAVIVLFVPKDIDTPIKSEWFGNMEKVGANIKTFFEKEFDNNITISYEVLDDPVVGDVDISSYTPTSLTLETQRKTILHKKENSHTVWMIYLVRDPEFKKNIIGGNLGGLPQHNAATQFEFWLDTETFNSAGLVGSMHEFGHILGIPHPWELPANTSGDPNFGNVPGDLMSYTNSGVSIDDLYIREDVKEVMGL